MDSLELLLKQLEKQSEIIQQCQTLLTVAVVVCIVAIVVMLFIIFKGRGKFNKDEVIIGDVRGKEDLHKEVIELKSSFSCKKSSFCGWGYLNNWALPLNY